MARCGAKVPAHTSTPLHAGNFDLARAMRYLSFAAQFTPQYGDTFVEYLRLELVCQVILPQVLRHVGLPYAAFVRTLVTGDENADSDASAVAEDGARTSAADGYQDFETDPRSSHERRTSILALENFEVDPRQVFHQVIPRLEALVRKCMNADPNYGTLWFFCRDQPCDTARGVLHSARQAITQDLIISQRVYMRAVSLYVRRWLQEAQASGYSATDDGDWTSLGQYAPLIEDILSDYSAVETDLRGIGRCFEDQLPLLECCGDVFASVDFVTALVDQNRSVFNKSLSDEARRSVLFNSSQIIP